MRGAKSELVEPHVHTYCIMEKETKEERKGKEEQGVKTNETAEQGHETSSNAPYY